LLLRVGVALCFYGHGTFGFIYKESWVPFFSYFGISREWARFLEFVIGSIDYFVATLALLIPFPALFAYAAFWGTWTAFLRPLTGLGWWELFDRAGNFGVALAVLALYLSAGFTNKQWFKPSFPRLDSERKVVVVARVLQITTALFLLGHAGLAFGQRKALLAHHMESVAAMVGTHDPLQYLLRVSGLVDVSLMFAVLCYPVSRILLLAVGWKIATESLYPLSGDYIWEFIERGGNYVAPLALFVIARGYQSLFYRKCLSLPNFRRWLAAQHQKGFYRSATLALACSGLLCFILGFSLNRHGDVSQYSVAVLKPKEVQFLSGRDLLDAMRTQPVLIYFRHFPTQLDPSRNDRKSWFHGRLTLDDFADCSWQRELHPFGRELAKSVGAQLDKLSLKINKVLASPYCRCIESAQLMTGRNPELDLGLIYPRAEHTTERMETAFQNILLDSRNWSPGMLTVVVGHRNVVDAFGSVHEGDAVVFIRDDKSYRVAAKIAASEWLSAGIDINWLGFHASSGQIGGG
jgi:phosphohistidine phosphatase SixA